MEMILTSLTTEIRVCSYWAQSRHFVILFYKERSSEVIKHSTEFHWEKEKWLAILLFELPRSPLLSDDSNVRATAANSH